VKSKTVKRVILILLLAIMTLVFVGYRVGLFNGFLIKYYKDTTTSASVDTEISETQKQKTIDKVENVVTPAPPKEIETEITDFNQNLVSIIQSSKTNAEKINFDDIKSMVTEAINLSGGLEGVIKDHQVVVLKPNLVQMHVDSTGQLFDKEINGATTDWRVTKAVAQVVRQYNPNGKIYIMEGSGGDSTRKTMEHLNYTHAYIPEVDEFIAIEEDTGKWQDYSSKELIKLSLPNGLLHKEYYLNKKYFQCDVLVSIPCLKTNSGAIVSGAIKNVSIGATPANIYGVSSSNPGRTRMVSHKIIDGELDKWLHDYYMCKPVNFVVMDGLQGFQNGPVPMGKKNIMSDRMNMRLIMAGKDAIAIDTIEALILGWDPESIPYLKTLSNKGMGITDTSKISVVGKLVDEVRKNFKIRFTNLGGVPIPGKNQPLLRIRSQKIIDNKLIITLNIGEDTTKVEVYVDNRLEFISIQPDCKEVVIDISNYSKGKHEIKIFSYDRFLNHAEAQTKY
jgi:uncharacterized protein (DUF362 family)